MPKIKNKGRSRQDLHDEIARLKADKEKLKSEIVRVKVMKDPEPPTEEELDKRRWKLIEELTGYVNELKPEDYDPDKLAACIEEEERVFGKRLEDLI